MIDQMNTDELKDKMDKNENFVLVDCREQEEWDEGHIPGAKFMPLSKFDELYSELKTDDNIIVYCRSGKRSMKACQFLMENDYENLTNVEGGILDWVNSGFPLTQD